MANQFLALGLFIMLLSFFIVLNSLSTFEEHKSEAVINSLNEAFVPKQKAAEDLVAQAITMPEESMRDGDALDNIRNLFQSAIPDAETKKNRFGTLMTTTLPRAQFESALAGGATGDALALQKRFTAMLVGMLSLSVQPEYQIDIILNVPENPAKLQDTNPAAVARYIKTAATYAAILEQEGLDKRRVTTGIEKGKADTIKLTFRPYLPLEMDAVQ